MDNLHMLESIVFETVLLNERNGYHKNHGIFIAPVTERYVSQFPLHIKPMQVLLMRFLLEMETE